MQGATIDYHFFNALNASGGTWGPRVKASFARSVWHVIDTTENGAAQKIDTLRQVIPLTAVDLGFRFAFINHLEDPKQNTYSVGLDTNFLVRLASPNSKDDNRAVTKALESTDHRLVGAGLSFWVKLRQVTATADFPYIRPPKTGPIDGLTRVQPTVTIRYSSPIVNF